MVIRAAQFNLYLLLALTLVCGCQTGDKQKPKAVLQVHLEVGKHESAMNGPVPIYRAQPIIVNVDKAPFLTELDVTRASVVDVPGGFVIKIQFDEHGVMVLQQYSVTNPGKHFVIHSVFGRNKKELKDRWLAAPLIPRHIQNGILTFTPDADREEAQIIVDGLNEVAGTPNDGWTKEVK